MSISIPASTEERAAVVLSRGGESCYWWLMQQAIQLGSDTATGKKRKGAFFHQTDSCLHCYQLGWQDHAARDGVAEQICPFWCSGQLG